jgi:hypothetical protein
MVKIQLDTAAMDKLFPEGTQARVDLQTSVIASLAGRYLKPGAELEKSLKEHQQKAVNQACAEFGLKRATWGNGFDLTAMASERIKEQAMDTVNTQIRNIVNTQLKETLEGIDARIQQRINYEINEIVKAKVAARFKEISEKIVG